MNILNIENGKKKNITVKDLREFIFENCYKQTGFT